MPSLAVILPAAGNSTRFGRNKLGALLDGVPVLVRTLRALQGHPAVAEIVVAANDPDTIELIRSASSAIKICSGGATRADSVLLALRTVSPDMEWVAVHDGARPLLTTDLIDATLCAAVGHGAAVPALPISLTIKQASGPLPSQVQRTLPRHELWAMQTPQITRRIDLLDAYANCPIPLDQITDDMQLLELQGKAVWLVPGEERNLKITTTLDLKLAELLLK